MIEISSAEVYAGYGLVVFFSDGTNSRYSVEELLALHPKRETKEAAAALSKFAALLTEAKGDLMRRKLAGSVTQ